MSGPSPAALRPAASVPGKRRGRPLGARSKVLADGRALGAHHIAFLRAGLQGLDLRPAWQRYMAFVVEASDLRVMESTRAALWRAVLAQGAAADRQRPELGLAAALRVLGAVVDPAAPSPAPPEPTGAAPAPVPVATRPSLDEWVAEQGLDPDFSEAELLELYLEHFEHAPDPPSPAPVTAVPPAPLSALHHALLPPPEKPDSSTAIRALNQLAAVVTQPPSPADGVARWLAPKLASAVQRAGAATLADLVSLVNLYGFRWYAQVEGLGVRRAASLLEWLRGLVDTLPGFATQGLRASSLSPPQQQQAWAEAAAREVVAAPAFALVPLDRLRVPAALDGAAGRFRSSHPNTLGAEHDLAAVRAWLSRYERAHTQRAYRKEVERFYLWCLLVARKPLSSIDSQDCRAYRLFLADLPADWVQQRRVARHDPGWRPFAGPLTPSSQKQALVVVQVLFEGLQKSGYLVANPMAQVMKGFDLPAARIRTERSLTRVEWTYLRTAAQQGPATPEQGRVALVLELLVTTGLRLQELAQARLADLERVTVDGEDDLAWVLHVTGKRRKRRSVPLDDALVAQVHAHHRDQVARGIALPPSPALIGCLEAAPPRWAADGARVGLVRPAARQALSASGLYRCLKRFFVRAAREAGRHGLDGERLATASTHWLRHTFGRQAVERGVPTPVVQFALGHESLATTGIYVTAERSQMIKALRAPQPIPDPAD